MREKFILDLLTVMAGQIGKNQRKFFLALAQSHKRKKCIHQKDVLTRPECVSKIVSTLNQLLSYCDENPKKKKNHYMFDRLLSTMFFNFINSSI
jgi:hypothetical protein